MVGMALGIMPMRQSFSLMSVVSLITSYSQESISKNTQQRRYWWTRKKLSCLQNESNICTYQVVVLQFVCKQLLHPVS